MSPQEHIEEEAASVSDRAVLDLKGEDPGPGLAVSDLGHPYPLWCGLLFRIRELRCFQTWALPITSLTLISVPPGSFFCKRPDISILVVKMWQKHAHCVLLFHKGSSCKIIHAPLGLNTALFILNEIKRSSFCFFPPGPWIRGCALPFLLPSAWGHL